MAIRFSLKATGMDLTPDIRSYTTEKVRMLEKYLDPSDTSVFAEIEVGRTTRHHQSGLVFRAEITMHIAGKSLRAVAEKEEIRAAIDEMKDNVARELRRGKRKDKTFARRGGAFVKGLIRKFYR